MPARRQQCTDKQLEEAQVPTVGREVQGCLALLVLRARRLR